MLADGSGEPCWYSILHKCETENQAAEELRRVVNVTLTYNNGWRICVTILTPKHFFHWGMNLAHQARCERSGFITNAPDETWIGTALNNGGDEASTDAQKRAGRDFKRLKPWDFDFMPLVSTALPITLSAKKELLASISSTLSYFISNSSLPVLLSTWASWTEWWVTRGWGNFTVSVHAFPENQAHDLDAASSTLYCLQIYMNASVLYF